MSQHLPIVQVPVYSTADYRLVHNRKWVISPDTGMRESFSTRREAELAATYRFGSDWERRVEIVQVSPCTLPQSVMSGRAA